MPINLYLSVITWNFNKLNAPIKRHRVSDWKKTRAYNMLPMKTHFRAKNTHRVKVKGWENIFHANGNDKKVGVAILISDKPDFKTKAIKKDKEGL